MNTDTRDYDIMVMFEGFRIEGSTPAERVKEHEECIAYAHEWEPPDFEDFGA